jgi:hypothetical protein
MWWPRFRSSRHNSAYVLNRHVGLLAHFRFAAKWHMMLPRLEKMRDHFVAATDAVWTHLYVIDPILLKPDGGSGGSHVVWVHALLLLLPFPLSNFIKSSIRG